MRYEPISALGPRRKVEAVLIGPSILCVFLLEIALHVADGGEEARRRGMAHYVQKVDRSAIK